MLRYFVLIFSLLGISSVALAQLPQPEYTLYSPYFGARHQFTDEDLKQIARNFAFVYGQELTKGEMERARTFNPRAQFIKYVGNWTVRADVAEKSLRREIVYYQCATTATEIDANQTSFKLATIPQHQPLTLKASTIEGTYSKSPAEYVTWLRVGEEFMRIEAFDNKTNELRVTRGFDGTTPVAHKAAERVFSPAYGVAPKRSSEWENNSRLSYHYDTRFNARWLANLDALRSFAANGGDGIWIDILMDKSLREADHNGVELKILSQGKTQNWNFAANRNYTRDELRAANEAGVRLIQDGIQKETGRWPIIYGNNLMAARFEDGSGGHRNYLLSTAHKPRPIDGMCIEDWAGGYENDEWLRWRDKHEVSLPKKACYGCEAGYKNWRANVMELMKASQANLAALPLIINAGMKTAIFEAIPRAERHEWELWAYASYLLGVEKKDGQCPTKLGVPMFYVENGKRFVDLDPMYFWRVGEPAETRKPADVDQYQIKGASVYQRKFTSGLVLVNPSATTQKIELDRDYFDPENNQPVRQLEMKAQSGKILLRRK